ncbi:hypothetical protein EXW95_01920 [Deinococcus sp. JMULE3]|nr:hypothetical protein [Deinococcus sp. JMULE3]
MVNPDQSSQAQTPVKRRVIREVRQLFGISERRACRVLGFHRSTGGYAIYLAYPPRPAQYQCRTPCPAP